MRKFVIFSIIIFAFLIPLFASATSAPNIIYPDSTTPPIWSGNIKFQWSNTGTDFYKYHINIPDGSAKEEIIPSNSVQIYNLDLGNYNWAIVSCEDDAGINCGEWSPAENFEIISAPKEYIGGLVPCGRKYNNPDNPGIYESKSCEFSDLFVMMKMLLDFLLWRLGLIILVLVVLLAGVSSYFSFGSPDIINNLKRLKDSTIRGYAIIFMAWIFVNLILKLLGYTVVWWVITF